MMEGFDPLIVVIGRIDEVEKLFDIFFQLVIHSNAK